MVREKGDRCVPHTALGTVHGPKYHVRGDPLPLTASRVSVLNSVFHSFSQSGAVTNRQLGRDTGISSPDSNNISRNLGSGRRGRPAASHSVVRFCAYLCLDSLDDKMTI